MPDQGVRYVVRLDDINVTSGLRNMEGSAVRTEVSIAALNSTLRSVAGAFGIGFGINALVSFGKDAIQGASDYEVAVMRIKNVSKTAAEGLTNVAFINAEVDKLKIPLQEAADAYGNFLVKIANSGLAGEQVRKLHDEILTIAKVTGAPQGKMDSAVLDIGKMLAEGVLEARTLRQLERVFPQITPFIAEKMGLKQGKDAFAKVLGAATDESAATALQKLSRLESSGKLTKLGIDSKVLLSAIDAYYDSIKGKLPDTLDTIQSNINELGNDWLRFKNDLVLNNKSDLIDFLHELEGGIKLLVEHEKDIVTFGKTLVTLGKIWVGYKAAVMVINTALDAYNGFMVGYLGQTAEEVTATEARTVAMNALAVSMERVAIASEAIAAQKVPGFVPLAASGKGAIAAEEGLAGGAGGAAVAEGAGLSFLGGALLVAIAAGSIVALARAMDQHGPGVRLPEEKYHNPLLGHFEDKRDGTYGLVPIGNIKDFGRNAIPKMDTVWNTKKTFIPDEIPLNDFQKQGVDLGKKLGYLDENGKPTGKGDKPPSKPTNANTGGGSSPPKDHITGNKPITYNITIKEINGIKENKVEKGGTMDTTNVAIQLRDIIVSIVNDSQLRAAG